jgi:hypothetical protein
MRRIGVLLPAAEDDAEFQTWVGAFRQALALLGWTIGRMPEAETDTRRIEIDPTNPNRIYFTGNIPGRMGFIEVLTQ